MSSTSVDSGANASRLERKAKKERMKQQQLAAQANGSELPGTVSQAERIEQILNENDTVDPTLPQGNDIKVDKFTIFMGGKTLFKDANLTLSFGRRYGLVGYNGTGKSTLLHHLAARDGDFKVPRHIDILLVEQEVQASDKSALQTVIESDEVRLRLLEEEKRLLTADSKEDEDGGHGERLRQVYEKLQEIGSNSATARASAILSGLQFSEEMKQAPTKSFSGGWRMRISLARALFRKPRLLLLDEPTNHLDLHAVIWLESYLQNWPNTLVVVSHDRDFMNAICTDILQVWQQKLVHYKGDYEQFDKQFQTKLEQHKEAYEKQQKRIKALKKSGKVTTDVSKTSSHDSATKKKQRAMVTGKGKKGGDDSDDDDQKEELLQPLKDYVVRLFFTFAGELPMPLLKVENMSFAYPEKEAIFEDVDFGINTDSRIAIVGPNGTGKSTLLKLCTHELHPTVGEVRHNPKLRIGVYSQHSVDQLDMDKTPVSYLMGKFPELDYQTARKYLGTIGLPGSVHEHQMHTLSGGQKSRVVFVELQLTKCHILLLDEPTNHLDLETVDGLVEALKEFEGGVVVVTHNVSLISKVCTEIWECGLDKTVEPFQGDFEDYAAKLVQQLKDAEAL